MASRRLLVLVGSFLIASVFLLLSPSTFHAAPQMAGTYHVLRTIPLGGDGSWDYITEDPENQLVYAPRTENIQVLDLKTGKLAGNITGMKGLHGIAIAPEFNRGVATGNDPDAVAYIIDLKAMKVVDTIKFIGAKGSDSLSYDPFTKRVFVNTAGSNNAQVIDMATGKYVGSVTLPGRPEAAVSDGKGSMFVNIVDKDMVVEYDAQKMTVKNTYSSTPCVRGYGISMDQMNRRLFLSCQPTGTSGVLVVMNADSGKVVASIPIGVGADGSAFDAGTGDIFIPTRDDLSGTMGATYIFHEDTPDKYSNVAVVHTIYGARTGHAVDAKTHRFYTEATQQNNPPPNATPTADNPHPRLQPVANSFAIVEIGK